ncbi:carboxymuconolactone decarboxylase family protein [Xanthomonas sacchari]|uniref:carboxymuconolactone decarboxylase family protein n=1 Tax=Xanthomonas sacchari TaxID=56458 RepID=UPI003527A060
MPFHRIDYTRHEPEAYRALLGASQQVHDGTLGSALTELVFLRVSQLNGCAYCIDMHATALRKAGTEPRKLDTLAAWRDSRFFDARERAALDWAEALTTLPAGAPPQAVYDALTAQFDPAGISALTMAVAVINAWNRLGVGLQPALP